jgi:hypothetical protein
VTPDPNQEYGHSSSLHNLSAVFRGDNPFHLFRWRSWVSPFYRALDKAADTVRAWPIESHKAKRRV